MVGILRLYFLDGPGRPERLVVLRQDHFQRRGSLFVVRRSSRSVGCQPSTVRVKVRKVADLGDQFVVLVTAQTGQEPLMLRGDVAIEVGIGGQQGRNRHDQTDRLHVAEPLLMGELFRVFCHGLAG